jgi:hypothetical protein
MLELDAAGETVLVIVILANELAPDSVRIQSGFTRCAAEMLIASKHNR